MKIFWLCCIKMLFTMIRLVFVDHRMRSSDNLPSTFRLLVFFSFIFSLSSSSSPFSYSSSTKAAQRLIAAHLVWVWVHNDRLNLFNVDLIAVRNNATSSNRSVLMHQCTCVCFNSIRERTQNFYFCYYILSQSTK